jgi:hypothetical protein
MYANQLNNTAEEEGEKLYQRAKSNNLATKDRYNKNISHHSKSIELITLLMLHDFYDLQDYFQSITPPTRGGACNYLI